MVASPSLLLFKKVVNWGLTPQAINFAQSAFMGHRVCFSVPVDLMNEYFTWTRKSGELRPTGRFVAAPTTIANLPTFATAIERCLDTQYTDLDGVAEGLNYSSSALDCFDDVKRDPYLDNKIWDYSALPASVAVSAPAATHYSANDLVMAFVLNKCFGSSSFDAYDIAYNLDDGFGMLTSAQLAAAINLSMQEEENLASLCVLPAKALSAQLPGDNKGQVDAMFRSLLSIDAQRFHKNGRQITGLFETNTDADASGNWCLTVGDKIEVPIKLFFRSPVTVLSVVDGAQNSSSATPDHVETVFIKGEAASLDAHNAAQAAAASRDNIMMVRLQLVCSTPAISSSTRSTSEVAGANLAVVNKSNLLFYKGSHYPTQSALAIAVAGGTTPYTYAFTAGGTLDQVTSGAALNSPPGVTLSSSGSFSFNPAGVSAASGRWKANVTITDAAQSSVSTDIYVTVNGDNIIPIPPPLPSAPTKPVGITVSQLHAHVIQVYWNSGGVGASSYRYSLNGTPTIPLSDNGSNGFGSVTFGGLSANTSYDIIVTAVNAGGSTSSNTFNCRTPITDPSLPGPATILVFSAVTTSGFTVSWSGGNDATSYVYILNGSPATPSSDNGIASKSATFDGLSASTTYSIYVVSWNADGSRASDPFNVRTSDPPPPPPQMLLKAVDYSGTGAWNDEAGNGFNATLQAGVIAKNTDGNGIVLDGSTSWTFPNLTLSNSWTVALWYKDTGSSPNVETCIITKPITNSQMNISFRMNGGGAGAGNILPGFYNGLGGGWSPGYPCSFALNTWINIQVTWDGTTMATYKDSVLLATQNSNIVSVDNGEAYIIGCNWNSTNYVTGEIGEIRIYNTPLTQSQVTENYYESATIFIPPTQPTSLASSAITSSGFTVSWSGGSSATSYTYSLNGSPATPSTDNGVAAKSATFSGLSASTSYDVVVTAINAAGSSSSDPFNVTTAIPPSIRILLKAVDYSGTGAWNDEAGNGFNATLQTGVIAKNTAGNGIVLDGSTAWTFPNVGVANAWSVGVWYKNTGAQVGGSGCIIGQQNPGNGRENVLIGNVLGDGNIYSGFVTNYNSLGYSITLTDGNWTNIQSTWDGALLSMYKDGVLVGANNQGGAIAYDNGMPYLIGKNPNGGAQFMVGEIGEVRVYNYAIDQAQVTADYNESIATFSPPTKPTSLASNTVSTSGFTVSWSDGDGATSYTYSLNGSPATPSTDNGVAAKSATFSGLSASTSYDVVVTAINASGSSSSDPFNVTTATPPSLRILLKAVDYSGTGAWNDEAGNGFNATLQTGVIAKNTDGNGIVLDGSTAWTFPNVAVGNSWTAGMWYKNTDVIPPGAMLLTQVYNNAYVNLAISQGATPSSILGTFNNNNTTHDGTYVSLTIGEWTNIQITWDGTNMATYVNGSLVGTTQPGGTAVDSGAEYRIGRQWLGAVYMTGEIGEVRVYNYAIDQAQVTADYNESITTFFPPTKPTSLASNTVSSSGFTVTWSDGDGATSYTYTLNGSPATPFSDNGVATNSATFSGLSELTSYDVVVTAVNAAGSSSSDPFNVTTDDIAPVAPNTITITELTQTSISVSWSGGDRAASYSYSLNGTAKTPSVDNGVAAKSAIFSGLTHLTSYSLIVSALNSAGSTDSGAFSFTTLDDPATQPVTFSFSSVSQTAFTVSWFGGDVATSYTYKLNGSPATPSVDNGVAAKSATFSGLSANTSYALMVSAVNTGGADDSDVTTVTTLINIPAQPTSLTVVSRTQTTAVVSWSGGSTATSYTYSLNGSPATPSTDNGVASKGATFSGLSANTSYDIIVTAVNAGGSSSSSSTTVTTLVNIPSQPASIAIVYRTQTTAVISWSGGSTATSYTYSLNGTATTPFTDNGVAEKSATFSGLSANTSYSVIVTAVNDGGSSSSDATSVSTLANLPSQPTSLTVVSRTQTTAVVSWSGGAGATSYTYKLNGSPATPSTDNGVASQGATFSGLSANTSYDIIVTAVNNGGSSSSSVTNVTTLVNIPSQPASITLVSRTQTTLVVGWSGAAGATSYTYSLNGTATTPSTDNGLASQSATFSDLSANTSYSVIVTAVNNGGSSSSSATSVSTLANIPAQPTSITLVSRTQTTLVVSWSGGAGATSYTYSLNGTATTPFTDNGLASQSATFSGLSANTSYDIIVTAVNNGGSSSSSATTVSTLVNIPSQPTSLASSAITSSGFTVSWSGGSSATSYTYSLNGTAATPSTDNGVASQSATFSGLSANTSYSVIVTAVNAAGSTASNSLNVTTAVPSSLKILLTAVDYSGTGAWNNKAGNGLNATLKTGVIAKNTAGNGIVLNGSTSWTFPNLNLGNAWSVNLWYKDTGSPTNVESCILTQLYGNNQMNISFRTYGSFASSGILPGFYNSSNGGWVTGDLCDITKNNWINVQVTWDGTNMVTYKNSVLVATHARTGVSVDYGLAYVIGCNWGSSAFLTGEIGEVRIYNVALTQAQVTADYNASFPTFPPTPKIVLKAINYSGSGTWNDESGNAKNATLENGVIAKNTAGNGIVLNGSTSWTFPNVAVGNAWTAGIWYKQTAAHTTDDGACIITQEFTSSMNLLIGWPSGGAIVTKNTLRGGFAPPYFSLGTSITQQIGNWMNIQVTWNGTNIVTYINGALLGTVAISGTATDGALRYLIGRRWDGLNYVTGEIGEIRIYNFPLTQAQVTVNYNASATTFGLTTI